MEQAYSIKVCLKKEIHLYKGPANYKKILKYIKNSFGNKISTEYILTYRDEDNDRITVSCDEDIQNFLENAPKKRLNIIENYDASSGDEKGNSKKTSNEQPNAQFKPEDLLNSLFGMKGQQEQKKAFEDTINPLLQSFTQSMHQFAQAQQQFNQSMPKQQEQQQQFEDQFQQQQKKEEEPQQQQESKNERPTTSRGCRRNRSTSGQKKPNRNRRCRFQQNDENTKKFFQQIPKLFKRSFKFPGFQCDVEVDNNNKQTQENYQHYGVQCDLCGILNFQGMRYKCTVRDDYDLCGKCYEFLQGSHEYEFIPIKNTQEFNLQRQRNFQQEQQFKKQQEDFQQEQEKRYQEQLLESILQQGTQTQQTQQQQQETQTNCDLSNQLTQTQVTQVSQQGTQTFNEEAQKEAEKFQILDDIATSYSQEQNKMDYIELQYQQEQEKLEEELRLQEEEKLRQEVEARQLQEKKAQQLKEQEEEERRRYEEERAKQILLQQEQQKKEEEEILKKEEELLLLQKQVEEKIQIQKMKESQQQQEKKTLKKEFSEQIQQQSALISEVLGGEKLDYCGIVDSPAYSGISIDIIIEDLMENPKLIEMFPSYQ